MDRSVKAQMKYANKIGAKKVVIIGADELSKGAANVKDMATGEQTEVALAGASEPDFKRDTVTRIAIDKRGKKYVSVKTTSPVTSCVSPNAGETVTLVGWYENLRKVSKNLGFLILRDFYGTTQAVIETEEMMARLAGVNTESTLSITGVVRERSSKNAALPTGEIEVVPTDIQVLGRCRYNELPFEINHSKEADENTRLKYRYLDLRNPAVKERIVLRSNVVASFAEA